MAELVDTVALGEGRAAQAKAGGPGQVWHLGAPGLSFSQSFSRHFIERLQAGGRDNVAGCLPSRTFWAHIKSGKEASPTAWAGQGSKALSPPFPAGCSLKVLADSERYTWIVL